MEKASSMMGSIKLAEELSLEYDKGAIMQWPAGLKQMKLREVP